ncbi:SGNH/GDSL hydrolase family protein [Streptomyces hoynatensis]|uniref:SGNH/GDSL hydrolase family protein n=1 Tax=Streptomyces hoynatensis TaxID=1141874 RepID=A0A3A9YWP8_9ACTN|nr:SGNH/GDSL hydrolase family protein [Streptomyces hoynatensis]RKN40428.1 SGNH/GDSL hydrolase family protein [Streptomyces hoynatensis]
MTKTAPSPTRIGSAARALLALLAGALLLALAAPSASATPARGHGRDGWVGTWSTTVTTVPASEHNAFEDQTIRQVVHTSIAGESLTLRLSNEFGTTPLVLGEVHVARRAEGGSGSAILPGTDRTVTFGGARGITIPAGAPALSDPVALRLPAAADLVISLYLPEYTPATTVQAFSMSQTYLAEGDVTGARDIEATGTSDRWYFLRGVAVRPEHGARARAVVAFGDSITAGSSVGTDHRWSDYLAARLRAAHGLPDTGVLNQGVSGNRLLHDPNPPAGSPAEAYAALFGENALARFDRDVLAQPGVESVIVLLGINDIGQPGTDVAPASERVDAGQIIQGYRQLIARAHARGVRVIGGTLGPFEDNTLGFYSRENEAERQAVNAWVRTGGAFDGVADFDAALRDPDRPGRLRAAYDSGDHLHPNDAGNEAMAAAVPLRLFR